MDLAAILTQTPATHARLRQAHVVSLATSPPSATIRLGGNASTGDDIGGVRYLAGVAPIPGDTVLVLQQGGSLVIIGKVAPAGGTQAIAGLELYHPSSTPFIDFHRAANPAGDSNADYNVRLINDASGQLKLEGGHLVVSGEVTAGAARARSWSDANYAEFSDSRRGSATGDYSFLSSKDGSSYVNGKTGAAVYLRINNTSALTVGPNRDVRGSQGVATFGEAMPDLATLYNDAGVPAGNPNYMIKGGTVVLAFSGGNAHCFFGTAFPKGLVTVVAVNADGNLGWMVTTNNYNRTGFGAQACFHDGGLANGLLRLNFLALGF